MRCLIHSSLVAMLVASAGCATGHPSASSEAAPLRHPDPRVVLLPEIRTSGEANAYQLVETHRPLWLHRRGPESVLPEVDGDVVVYLNDARMGGRNALREIPLTVVGAIRFLDAAQANFRFGRSHPYGAIVISTDTASYSAAELASHRR